MLFLAQSLVILLIDFFFSSHSFLNIDFMSDKYHEPIPGYILLNLKQILNMKKKQHFEMMVVFQNPPEN